MDKVYFIIYIHTLYIYVSYSIYICKVYIYKGIYIVYNDTIPYYTPVTAYKPLLSGCDEIPMHSQAGGRTPRLVVSFLFMG